MVSLDTLNIRKGLELDVDVADIFKISTKAEGDIVAKRICKLGLEKAILENPNIEQYILDSGGLVFSSEKEKVKISESLTAYVYDSYLVDIEVAEDQETEIIFDSCKEIEFVNTEILDFNQFCENIMTAQSFAGKYKTTIFKFPFIGHGIFSLEEYACVHKMVSASNMHVLNFFLIHKKVLAGIGAFLTGLYRNDIMRQREYLTSKEFATLLDEAEQQFAIMYSMITDSTSD